MQQAYRPLQQIVSWAKVRLRRKFCLALQRLSNTFAVVDSNYAPVPPSDELNKTMLCLTLAHWPHYLCDKQKPEIHNILHCRQKRTEPRTKVTHADNLVSDMQTDRQTYRPLIAIPHPPTGGGKLINIIDRPTTKTVLLSA